jgi:arabinose-5-phosphate isomerase
MPKPKTLHKSQPSASDAPASRPVAIASALRTLETEAGGIAALSEALGNGLGETFAAVVDLIRDAKGRVILTGLGKSGHVARKTAATLASTGTPAFFVHSGEANHGDLGMITQDDVIIALSWSGEQPELKNIVTYAARFKIPLVALTSNAQSTLGQNATHVLELPKVREACPHDLAPTTSTLMQAALGDALAIALLESRGFTALEFAKFHPGGKLGAMLKFTRDVMHSGDAIPLASMGTPMSDAIGIMTAKSFGCVAIVDDKGVLNGIITDGDLRRHMSPNLLAEPVERVMTRSPTTVRSDQLVSEVLELLNSTKRTVVLVVDNGRPVGIIHMHDLLRAGVA